MWIVSNKGFMSIVGKDAAGRASGASPDGVVSVRFRRPKDAVALFPGHEVVLTPAGDYACRVFATRAEVAAMLVAEVEALVYENFKDSIPVADKALLHAAHRAWDVFGELQEGGPYGRDLPRLPHWWEEMATPVTVAVPKGKRGKGRKGGKARRVAA
jgi:hypothetical protein